MRLSWDEAKRQVTLKERGLDFALAAEMFDDTNYNYTIEDLRKDYGENRYISFGLMGNRLCVVVWTPREAARHIISMRKANEREQESYKIRAQSRG
jgi:uncharacterized protein